jgi:hypothetical protein
MAVKGKPADKPTKKSKEAPPRLPTKIKRECGDYEHADSFVATDGREYLVGIDKKRRYIEVWERDRHHCVKCGAFVPLDQMEPHHVAQNYGARRWDNADNLVTLCSGCHRGARGEHP